MLIGVLKGAFIFLADLVRQLKLEKVKIDFLQASSYGADTVSSENVVLKKDIDVDIRGKDVLVVEDIVDTGLTLACLDQPPGEAFQPQQHQGMRHDRQK